MARLVLVLLLVLAVFMAAAATLRAARELAAPTNQGEMTMRPMLSKPAYILLIILLFAAAGGGL